MREKDMPDKGLISEKGRGILYRKWEVPSPSAVMLMLHGLGGHSKRWESMAFYLRQKGISCYALELRGFGYTPGSTGHVDSIDKYLEDIKALYGICRRRASATDIYLCGESLGGLISFYAALRFPATFSGLVALSPAFGNTLKLSAGDYIKTAIGTFFRPRVQIELPMTPEMCTRDPGYIELLKDDEAGHSIATARMLYEIFRVQLWCRHQAPKISERVFFLLAERDKVVDNKKTKAVYDRIKISDKKLKEYPGMLHSIILDLGKEAVFKDISEWVAENSRPREGT
jgi:alpha-beta hydrolase superfamily lysophospholipase